MLKPLVKRIAVCLAMAGLGLTAVRGAGYLMRPSGPYVDFRHFARAVDTSTPSSAKEGDRLRFAVATMVSVEATFSTYRRLAQRICRDLGRKEAFIVRPSYKAVREALEQKQVDVAFVCTGTYARSLENGRIKLLVQPEFADGLEYRCLVIVPQRSPHHTFDSLRGAVMAFTDPESNTGCYVPSAKLLNRGYRPSEFFQKIVFTGSHDRSILAVAAGVVDAAAVDALVWKSSVRNDPSLARRVRVIWQSEVYGPPPIVVPKDLPKDIEDALREAFLALDEDPQGREILSEIGIKRFTRPHPDAYDTAIELYRELRRKGAADEG